MSAANPGIRISAISIRVVRYRKVSRRHAIENVINAWASTYVDITIA